MKEINRIDKIVVEILESNLSDDTKIYLYNTLKGIVEDIYESLEEEN